MSSVSDAKPSEEDFILTRVIPAPSELVFRAWTDCELFARWWGPRGYVASYCTVDPRPGGLLHYALRSPEGHVSWGRGIFRDVVPPERLAFLDAFSEEQGETVEPWTFGMSADWPTETLVELSCMMREGETVMTLHMDVFAPSGEAKRARQGWEESLDKLEELIRQLQSARE